MKEARIYELEREISELKSRLPAHSIPNIMMQCLIELEDELEKLKKEVD